MQSQRSRRPHGACVDRERAHASRGGAQLHPNAWARNKVVDFGDVCTGTRSVVRAFMMLASHPDAEKGIAPRRTP